MISRGWLVSFLLLSEVSLGGEQQFLSVKTRELIENAFGQRPRQRYRDLDKRLGGHLAHLFGFLPRVYMMQLFVNGDQTREAYKELLIIALRDDRERKRDPIDLGEAMFPSVLATSAPPRIVVEAIVPELGRDGRLRGLLEDPRYEDIVSYMQHQDFQGHIGPPDFRDYARYLSNHKNEGRPTALVRHMYRLAPAKALYALMYAEYGIPYPPPRLTKNPDVNRAVRPLFYAEHIISDVIWHWEHQFEIEPERVEKAKQLLARLVERPEWWVRLYAAEILRQHPRFRSRDFVQKLKKDKDQLVRDAVSAVADEEDTPQ